MTKVTDDQIREKEMLVAAKKITRKEAHQQLGITGTTYYRRLKVIAKRNEDNKQISKNVILTVEVLDREAKEILETLKEMKKSNWESDKHDKLDLINSIMRALTNYRNALKSADINIDARQQTVNIITDEADDICFTKHLENYWVRTIPKYLEQGRARLLIEETIEVREADKRRWKCG